MGIRQRLGIAVLAAVATFPAGAEAEHTRIALESTGPAGGNGALVADTAGAAVPGKRVLVITAEQLTAGDTDDAVDVYARTSASTTLLTAGGTQGNGTFPANYGYGRGAGGPLVFQTDEQLTSADTDSSFDVYVHDGSVITLVSTGPGAGANGAFDCFFAAASTDATRIFFTTRAQLTNGDTDASLDVYERSGGTTRLVSTGDAGGNGTQAVELAGINDTGTKAFFHTSEALTATDTDSVRDVYQRADGVTTLLSVGPGGANGPEGASYAGSSSDGSKVFVVTASPLVAGDTDDGDDVYERSAGTTVIHSLGPAGGNSGTHAEVAAVSEDGDKVVIKTTEQLVMSDRDTNVDLYQSAGGPLTILSPGGNGQVATDALFAASKDGDRVFFHSEEKLLANDTDTYQDVYESVNGTLTRISIGPGGGNGPAHAFLGGISDDGTRAFFETYESLEATDTDATVDVYERHAGATYRVSTGNGALDARFRAASADGMRVVFSTAESLVAGDTDGVADVYSANVPGTVRVVLNAQPDDPQDVSFTAGGGLTPTGFQLDDDSDGALSNTRIFANLAPASGYSVAQTVPAGWSQTSAGCDDGSPVANIDVAAGETVTCTFVIQRGYPRPRSATPVEVPLVPEHVPCTSPNRLHGPALEAGSCNPPLLQSSRLTTGTPDVNGRVASMEGRGKFNVMSGNPATPADEADVSIVLKATDVRVRTTLADYGGELQGTVVLRITDRLNGAGGDEIGTVTEVPLRVTVPCNVTADTTIGSSCYVSTSADAVLPGMVSESKRTIWQMGDVRVFDGGADGQAATQDNTPFLRQGLFVP